MLPLLRFYLFHKQGTVRRMRNKAAASLVFFLIAGLAMAFAWLVAWAYRGFEHAWPGLTAVSFLVATMLICYRLQSRAMRIHKVLEKYRDPVLYENRLFQTQDKDVAEALVYDSFGNTALALQKLQVAVDLSAKRPSEAFTKHD